MTHPIESSPPPMYQNSSRFAGVTGRRRNQLTLLHRAFDAPFDALQAAAVLDLDVERTRRLLAALVDSG